ncbi:hypothetical protein ECTW14313_1414, partial [Escherichia coli O157:H7 str. TW14313]
MSVASSTSARFFQL